ncbi:MAG: ABC transporter ATP-binding protein [Oscillospiraceae bacterium]|nr:ABC transporter ATP-binding protein [Oscillospiraceae bacterium]
MIYDVRGLRFAYPNGHQVINDASFTLDEGEVLTILGPNGAGKSTLFNCLANIRRPTGGEILLGGSPMDKLSVKEVAGLIGYVQQTHIAVFDYTVIYFVMMGRAARVGVFSRPKAEDRAIAMQALETLGIAHLAERPYTAISGGERQLVLIARALTQQPKAILLDEPTSHLDFGRSTLILELVRELQAKGYSVIMTTHDPNHAVLLGEKAALLDRSGILRVGPAEEIVTEENLRPLYRSELHIVDIESLSRRACLSAALRQSTGN